MFEYFVYCFLNSQRHLKDCVRGFSFFLLGFSLLTWCGYSGEWHWLVQCMSRGTEKAWYERAGTVQLALCDFLTTAV